MILSIEDFKKEQLDDFDCGNEELNRYLKEYSLQNNKKNISRTFVLAKEDKPIGYYSLANAQIGFETINEEMQRRLPKYPLPAIRISRLAVCKNEQSIGLGSELLRDAFLRILNVSKHSGVCFVIVDAKKEAQGFYEQFGFIRLSGSPSTLVLPVSTLEKAFLSSK